MEHQKNNELGIRLRLLRASRGISLRAVSKSALLTPGGLSQIENGKNSPSVATLKRILEALGTTLGEFFASEGASGSSYVFRAHELVDVANDPGLRYMALPRTGAARALHLMDEYYSAGADTGSELYTHAGEEVGICISGSIELTVGEDTELLGPGDVFYFDSTKPHRWRNAGSAPARMITVCTPPSF